MNYTQNNKISQVTNVELRNVSFRLNEIVGDKTAIYISHRLSSCRFCDQILVLDHGEIVQYGTHEELLREEQGTYYELWNAQAQCYTDASAAEEA